MIAVHACARARALSWVTMYIASRCVTTCMIRRVSLHDGQIARPAKLKSGVEPCCDILAGDFNWRAAVVCAGHVELPRGLYSSQLRTNTKELLNYY